MFVSVPLPSTRIHCQVQPGEPSPSASLMPERDALSVAPTPTVPDIVGTPVGAAFGLNSKDTSASFIAQALSE